MREQLLNGRINLPNYEGFTKAIGTDAEVANSMLQAMYHNYLKNKGSISLIYWANKFSGLNNFNIVLKSLSTAGWIEAHSIPARNWAEANIREEKLLEYVTYEELINTRAYNKFVKYRLDRNTASANNKVSLNGKIAKTGLEREGFRLASNIEYRYDTNKLAEYKEAIQANLTKSMDKLAKMYPELKSDEATYDTISCDILNYHIMNDFTMSNGQNKIDSRGRCIQGNLGKVTNYISCKDMRAVLVIP